MVHRVLDEVVEQPVQIAGVANDPRRRVGGDVHLH